MFGSFLPGLWLVGTTKVYSGMGADIVMESLAQIYAFLSPIWRKKRRKVMNTACWFHHGTYLAAHFIAISIARYTDEHDQRL